MAEGYPSVEPHSPRLPLTSQPNGYSKPLRSNTFDSQRQYYEEDQTYLGPTPVTELQRKRSDITPNGSDPDSALDYYKPPESKNRSRNASRNRGKKKGPLDPNWVEVEKNDANWIHRDKLKEIETRELEEAGFRVGRASRSNSSAQTATRTARDRKNSEAATDSTLNSDEKSEQRRVVSPIPAAEEPEDDPGQWDLRTPEEIAEETNWIARNSNNNHAVRPSTSRIPVAKTSPLPVPSTFVERDAPLPRPRTGSNNWNGDAIAVNGARVRSGSVSSQVLLDEPVRASGELLRTPLQNNFSHPMSPISTSPTKAKTPGKLAPTSGGRKTSAQRSNSQAKPRNSSGPSPGKRPGTSGGSISRPTTGHRPEGEAPWIATMYKPDPRLPPDQQIIPTHAKRMQQEQWETEGRVGSMYDRDFRLLNTDEFKDKRNSQIQPLELDQLERPDDDPQWPLPSPTKQTMEPLVRSPTNEQGGYKLTPTIPQSPRVPSRAESSRAARTTSPKPTKMIRLPEPPPENVKEKKNCCCIVM